MITSPPVNKKPSTSKDHLQKLMCKIFYEKEFVICVRSSTSGLTDKVTTKMFERSFMNHEEFLFLNLKGLNKDIKENVALLNAE